MSGKEKKFIGSIVKLLENHCSSLQVQTAKIGRNLLLFKKPICLDLQQNLTLDLQDEDTYNQVLWTFVASTQLSETTKKLLKKNHLTGIIASFD